MRDDESSLSEGLRITKDAAKLGVKIAKTFGKSINIKIYIFGSLALVLLVVCLVAVSSISQLGQVLFISPKNEETYLKPSESNREDALYDRDLATTNTEKLLEIINNYKSQDKEFQKDAIKKFCKINDYDIDRTMNLLSDNFEIMDYQTGATVQDGRVLAAFSISLDNGEIIKTGPFTYTNQKGVPVKTYIFGEKAGEIDYEKSLKEELKSFLSRGHFYELSYEMEDGHVKVYRDVEVDYDYDEVDVLDEEGKPTGETKKVWYAVYTYYYYVHPILTEKDINSIAEDIFGLNPEATYVNSGFNGKGEITIREAINKIAQGTQALLYESAGRLFISGFNGTYEWPAPGNFRITSLWGPRYHPITHAYSNHSGMDIAGVTGSPAVAADKGTVIFAGVSGTYGNLIKVQHEDGNVTYYAHLSQILVREGIEVQRGEEIGRIGSTGQSTGPHLHFEVRINGVTSDPIPWICTEESYEKLIF